MSSRTPPGVKLTAIYAFEHGINGTREDNRIESYVDEATGAPIYSLYNGDVRKPAAAMLKDVDVLVYDKQDNGARFCTSVTSMAYLIEAAAENHLAYYVLDRAERHQRGRHRRAAVRREARLLRHLHAGFSVRHGMTMGEMARYFNGEKKLGADLHVVPLRGWKRSMWFDETGLDWVNPSPNIRNLAEAILYPGTCLLESKLVSVGRGTDTPFEIVGAPWFRAREVASYLNSPEMPFAATEK